MAFLVLTVLGSVLVTFGLIFGTLVGIKCCVARRWKKKWIVASVVAVFALTAGETLSDVQAEVHEAFLEGGSVAEYLQQLPKPLLLLECVEDASTEIRLKMQKTCLCQCCSL